ncbi:MAG: BT_3928 family protein [Rikenellaceae bacterium]
MKKPNRYNPILKKTTHLFCVIIGITFIVSGFTKAIDPWGTAMKFEEYFSVYGFNMLMPLARVLAVWLCGAEMMMGCMILCRVRLRLISIFALISMTIFTIVTILSVTFYPVEDCGCFGDVLYLTPRQTLIKNLVLLPMIITIWWRYRPDKILVYKPREVILATLFCIGTMSFSAWNYLHLPMIDFLPYKVGIDMLSEVELTVADVDYSVALIYRNVSTGELRKFSLDDTEWQDSSLWEWVETRTDAPEGRPQSLVSDFSLTSADGSDATRQLLAGDGKLNLIAITAFDSLRPGCKKRIEEYVAKAMMSGEKTVVVSPQAPLGQHYSFGDYIIECYNIDTTTFKSMMRASAGVVELTDGVITAKRSCFDM